MKKLYLILCMISVIALTQAQTNVQDGSGNTYQSVKIGTQVWLKENLRTEKYNDGTPIPLVSSEAEWAQNHYQNKKLPMMCWFVNNKAETEKNKTGALYNAYVIDPKTNGNKNVCPVGFHVPNTAELEILITKLGGYNE